MLTLKNVSCFCCNSNICLMTKTLLKKSNWFQCVYQNNIVYCNHLVHNHDVTFFIPSPFFGWDQVQRGLENATNYMLCMTGHSISLPCAMKSQKSAGFHPKTPPTDQRTLQGREQLNHLVKVFSCDEPRQTSASLCSVVQVGYFTR